MFFFPPHPSIHLALNISSHIFGHLATNNPNRRLVSLVEEVEDQEKEMEPIYDEFEDKIIYRDLSEALVIHKSFNFVQSKDDNMWFRYIFHNYFTAYGQNLQCYL